MEFLAQADVLLKSFWYLALGVSVLFIIQTVMTFIGADSGDGIEPDFDGDLDMDTHGPSQVFSLRNLINFLIGFSWTGVAFYDVISNKYILVVLAAMVGSAFVAFFFWLMKQMNQLNQDNTTKVETAIGRMATVYLTIPNNGKGKVHIVLGGGTREYDAVSTEGDLATGTLVKVVEVLDGHTLVVSKKN
ncbi:MAG: NfeD family protein [Cytophagaceae bacterium]|jgi:membrane protein implicated in regulation of membrane protease activity|nr:NfeD family protein [Cytophagaceae bacterium]